MKPNKQKEQEAKAIFRELLKKFGPNLLGWCGTVYNEVYECRLDC